MKFQIGDKVLVRYGYPEEEVVAGVVAPQSEFRFADLYSIQIPGKDCAHAFYSFELKPYQTKPNDWDADIELV